MKPLWEDTHPKIEAMMIAHIQVMTPAERFRKVGELNRALDTLAEADIRRRYPTSTDREIRLRVASRRIPADLMRKAFGWNPDVEGR